MPRFLLLFFLGVLAFGQTADSGADSIAELTRMMQVQVQTAALRKQSLEDAPASVTVITAEEIRRYGYRTIAEALANVRGFYTVSDGDLRFAGVRGFSLLGDYNVRVLVLLNGHQLTDNVYSAMYYFGEDFPVEMDMVDQIEIVRGPSSALYGSNGLFATINVITKTAANSPRARVSAEAGPGSVKMGASVTRKLWGGAQLLLSASGQWDSGRTATFPDLAAAGLPGRISRLEADETYRTFANLSWGHWTVTSVWGGHKSAVPYGWYGTVVGSDRTVDREARDFVEAAWTRGIGKSGEIRWRTYYDRYRYDGVYDYTGADGSMNYDGAWGDWVGSQFVYQVRNRRMGILTLGAESNFDLRNVQYNFSMYPDVGRIDSFRLSHPRASGGVFVQDEWKVSPAWTLYLGGRVDANSSESTFFSPRAVLAYTRSNSAYKFMLGRAFRNPSTFERYWEPSPDLRAESIQTVEVAREQTIRKRVRVVTTGYYYRLNNLIEGVPVDEETLQYRNTWRASAWGVEAEISGHPVDWLETAASISEQRARREDTRVILQNSPRHLAQFRASLPLWRQKLLLTGAVRYVGARSSAFGERVPPFALADLTLTTQRLGKGMDLQFGVRNLLNRAYSDPLSAEHVPHFLPGAGRNLFVRLIWRDE